MSQSEEESLGGCCLCLFSRFSSLTISHTQIYIWGRFRNLAYFEEWSEDRERSRKKKL